MNDTERLEQLFDHVGYMTLAVTLADGTPWATPVKIQKRADNVFEWVSKTDTEHSKAIANQPHIAISIWEKDGDLQFGLYAKATAELTSESENGTGFYRATVREAWVNDETFVKRRVQLGGEATH